LNVFHVNRENFSHKLLRGLITFIMVDFCWIFFRAPSARAALEIIGRIFSAKLFMGMDALGMNIDNIVVLIMAICVLIGMSVIRNLGIRPLVWLSEQNTWFRWCVYYVLVFVILIFGVYGSAYDASSFIYFQF